MAAPKGNKNAKGHRNALGNKGGRPALYTRAADLQKKVNAYFKHCEKITRLNETTGMLEIVNAGEPITITGLVLFLGFDSRKSLNDYETNSKFSAIIKTARTRVENAYEKSLHYQSPTGAIFALKNMGWADKQEVVNTNLNTNLNVDLTKEEVKMFDKELEDDC